MSYEVGTIYILNRKPGGHLETDRMYIVYSTAGGHQVTSRLYFNTGQALESCQDQEELLDAVQVVFEDDGPRGTINAKAKIFAVFSRDSDAKTLIFEVGFFGTSLDAEWAKKSLEASKSLGVDEIKKAEAAKVQVLRKLW